MLETPVSLFLERAASKSPSPGGGSVAALAGAMGASMASMAANFTIGKKGYEQVREEAEAILKTSEKTRRKLSSLAELDISAYEKVAAACKLPDDEGKKTALRKALKAAMEIPLETALECASLMKVLPRLAGICNKNLITDVGVAGYLLDAGLKSAVLNVEINLSALKDGELSREKRSLLAGLLEEAAELLAEIKSKVEREVAGR